VTAFRCSVASAHRGEAMLGTASGVVRWLLVEQPGPWQAQAPPRGRMAADVHARAMASAAQAGARLLAIRRPGRDTPAEHRTVMLADSRIGLERLLARSVDWDDDLTGLRLPGPTEAPPPPWSQVPEPTFLACTHGQHDICCALQGRPIAAALAALLPEQTWECSHVGGDRFAGNLIVLPAGHYFGRVDAAAAVQVADAYLAGRLTSEHLRGRSSLMMPAQAAQHFARAATGLDGVDDLRPLGVTVLDAHTWQVRLAVPDGSVEVTVRRALSDERVLLTCGADLPQPPPAFELVDLVAQHRP